MDKDTKEFLQELKADIKEINKKVDDLMAWKNKLMGAFIAVSIGCSFLITEIKNRLGIL